MSERLFRKCISKTRESLLNSSISFFGETRYRDYFDSEGNLQLNEDVTAIVRQYHSLDLWDKIFCYLTTPIDQYLVLNDILALKEMEAASVEESLAIHEGYHLGQHVEYIGWLVDSIHDDLEKKLEEMREKHLPDVRTKLKFMNRKLEKLQDKLSSIAACVTRLSGEVVSKIASVRA